MFTVINISTGHRATSDNRELALTKVISQAVPGDAIELWHDTDVIQWHQPGSFYDKSCIERACIIGNGY